MFHSVCARCYHDLILTDNGEKTHSSIHFVPCLPSSTQETGDECEKSGSCVGEKEEELLKKGNVGGCGCSVCVGGGEFTEVILLEAG